ncbi:MAG: hypothetical protein M1818_002215 [Claussenomyces sp. TS43310]|nr:MAG: hypothetical protein M1818_002215 [Claussenomyces sp. TS43310]
MSSNSASTGGDAPDSKSGGMLSNLLSGKTPGVSNIEAAYSRAGACNNHTPGVATTLGSYDQKPKSEGTGVGTDHFADNLSDQRAEPSAIGKVFNNMINGTERGK